MECKCGGALNAQNTCTTCGARYGLTIENIRLADLPADASMIYLTNPRSDASELHLAEEAHEVSNKKL